MLHVSQNRVYVLLLILVNNCIVNQFYKWPPYYEPFLGVISLNIHLPLVWGIRSTTKEDAFGGLLLSSDWGQARLVLSELAVNNKVCTVLFHQQFEEWSKRYVPSRVSSQVLIFRFIVLSHVFIALDRYPKILKCKEFLRKNSYLFINNLRDIIIIKMIFQEQPVDCLEVMFSWLFEFQKIIVCVIKANEALIT